jgi:single-strand DNA-binding protein
MNSFKISAVGNLAGEPEMTTKGDSTYTRFCLMGTDYAGKDEEGNTKEVTSSVWFVAFNGLGEAINKHCRKGDQLIVGAHFRANNWTDKQGQKHYDHSYIVDEFRFGAKGRLSREEYERANEE